MKLIAYIFGSLTLIIALILGLLFSSAGNSILASKIQDTLDEYKTDIRLDKFVLGFSDIDILLTLGENATFSIDGKISLFKQEIISDFKINIADMSTVKVLKENNLRGAFNVDGKVEGNSGLLTVMATTKSLGGSADVEIQLKDFQAENANIQTNSLELGKILYAIGKNGYADALINLSVNAKGLTHGIQAIANVDLDVFNGSVNAKMVNADFGLNFKKEVAFNANIDSELQSAVLSSKLNIGGDIANIYSKSVVELTNKMAMDADYSVSIANLNSLYFITQKILNGSIVIEGTVKGDEERLIVNGKSDIFDSQNSYYVTFKDYSADTINFNFLGMKIEKMLYMLNLPQYSKGLIDLDGSIKSLSNTSRHGQINTKISNASLNKEVLNKEVNLSMRKNIAYLANVKTELEGNKIDSSINFESSVANLHVKEASFNMDTGSLVADYLVKIEELKNLYFVTKQDLKGAIDINGDIKLEDKLDATAHSETLGGTLDAHLMGDELNANIKGIELLKLFEMLTYPEVFNSKADAKILFDLKTGDMRANLFLDNGHFVPNQLTTILRKVANIDLENEFYKNVTVDATMKKGVVNSKLDMKSQNSRVTVDDFILETITEKLSGKVGVNYKKREVYAKIGGTLKNPKVKLNMNKLMKSKGKKELEKLVPKKHKEALKNIFKLF